MYRSVLLSLTPQGWKVRDILLSFCMGICLVLHAYFAVARYATKHSRVTIRAEAVVKAFSSPCENVWVRKARSYIAQLIDTPEVFAQLIDTPEETSGVSMLNYAPQMSRGSSGRNIIGH